MKLKKIITLLLTLTMVMSLFAGCGKSEKDEAQENGTTTETAAEDTAAEDAEEGEPEEIAEINMAYLTLGPAPAGTQAVQDAINAIAEKEIGVRVTLEPIDVGSYSAQVNMKISGGEKMDIMQLSPIPTAGFAAFMAQKQLLPLDEYMAAAGQETLNALGDLVKATTVNGQIYGLPGYRDLRSSVYVIMRSDMLAEQGLQEKATNLKSFTEFEEILKTISENYDMAALAPNDGNGTLMAVNGNNVGEDSFADASTYDTLGDTTKLIAIDPGTKTVYNYFASEQYKKMLERGHDWYQKGYVYKDGATSDEHGDSLMKSNATFAVIKTGEPGIEASMKGATGYDVTALKLSTPAISTSNATKFGWAVPVTATEPEAAVKFLNLMYTNKDIANLLCWGIEGTDYVVVDGVAQYPEGKDATTVSYHSADFLWGNQFLAYPWQGEAANAREEAEKGLKEAGYSEFLGFSCDTSTMTNDLTAVSNVITEYQKTLESGSVDMSYYDEFLAKLQAAGADKVIAEYQKQLDAWMAANQ